MKDYLLDNRLENGNEVIPDFEHVIIIMIRTVCHMGMLYLIREW